ncbi:MAG: hypothetical protein ABIQ95_08825 [Bdellovibrionia bacterium]
MKFKLFSTVIFFPLFILGCEHIPGTLNVSSELSLNEKGNEVFTLSPGSYKMAWTEINVDGKKYVEIELSDAAGQKHNLQLPLPEDYKGSNDSSSFQLKAEEIKQSYDLTGHFKMHSSNSESVHTSEYCEIPAEGAGASYGYGYGYIGGYEYLPGQREVIYHTNTITYALNAELNSPRDSSSLAQFEAEFISTSIIYDFEGVCHL